MYWISTIGRSPRIASPMPWPRIVVSRIPVSATRSSPYFSCRSGEALVDVAELAEVLAEGDDFAVSRASAASKQAVQDLEAAQRRGSRPSEADRRSAPSAHGQCGFRRLAVEMGAEAVVVDPLLGVRCPLVAADRGRTVPASCRIANIASWTRAHQVAAERVRLEFQIGDQAVANRDSNSAALADLVAASPTISTHRIALGLRSGEA